MSNGTWTHQHDYGYQSMPLTRCGVTAVTSLGFPIYTLLTFHTELRGSLPNDKHPESRQVDEPLGFVLSLLNQCELECEPFSRCPGRVLRDAGRYLRQLVLHNRQGYCIGFVRVDYACCIRGIEGVSVSIVLREARTHLVALASNALFRPSSCHSPVDMGYGTCPAKTPSFYRIERPSADCGS